MKILIAEDDSASREMLRLVFNDFGACVTVANGEGRSDNSHFMLGSRTITVHVTGPQTCSL